MLKMFFWIRKIMFKHTKTLIHFYKKYFRKMKSFKTDYSGPTGKFSLLFKF